MMSEVRYFLPFSIVRYNGELFVILRKQTELDGTRIVTLDNRTHPALEVPGNTPVEHVASPLETAHQFMYGNQEVKL